MVLNNFEYLAPKSVGEACNLAVELGEGAKIMAGGTDVVIAMKEGFIKPEHIIDIKRIPGLDYIKGDRETGIKIGALTSLRDISFHPMLKQELPAVADAAHFVASTQVRSRGTMVGNICNASLSCDTGPILLALGVKLNIQGAEHSYVLPIEDFFKGVKRTALEQGEIVTEIQIPPLAEDTCCAYIKHAYRKAMDLAIVGVAAVLTVNKEGACTDARIGLGAVATTPVRSAGAEKILIGNRLSDDVIEKASVAAMDDCNPISDVRASAEYRKDMVRVFTKRAIKKALESRNL